MAGNNYNFSIGGFLSGSPRFNSSGLVTPQLTPKPVDLPTFDPEEGMYDAYIEARNAAIGANASKRKLERFYKKFRKQWDEGEALRKSEFEWNQGMAEANKKIDDARLRIMSRGQQVIQNFKESFKPFENTKPVINTPVVLLESAYAKAKREGNVGSLIGQDPYAAAAISAEEQNIVPITRGFGDRQVSVNPDDVNYGDGLLVSPSTEQNGVFSSNTSNSAGKKFTGTFNNMDEFNKAFTDWYGERNGFWSFKNNSREWDAARDNMLLQYLKYHNLNSLPQRSSKFSADLEAIIRSKYSPEEANRILSNKNGGNINKFAGGGNMNDQELQKAFMAYLIEDAAAQGMQIQSEQDLQAYAQQLGEKGLKAKYQEFMQKMQGGVKAALGAKLNYLHKLKGNCPDGYEMVYMKEGGRFCPKCMEKASKAKDGEKLNKKKNAIADFKERKKQHINPNDTVNTKFGPRDLNGQTKYPKYDANKENYDFNTRMRVQEKDEKSGKKVIGSACGSKMKKKK